MSQPQLFDQIPAPQPAVTSKPPAGLQGWTLILLCIGIGIIACCILIPQADENRKLRWETEKLQGDLDHLKKQAAVNDEFLKRVAEDPAVMERLAQRQMRLVRKGATVLELEEPTSSESRSAFGLLETPDPPPMPELTYRGGRIEALCRDPKSRLYLIGGALTLIAVGLVMGSGGESAAPVPLRTS